MIYIIFFIFGTALGSFLNVLIDRLPQGETILGRSHCDKCKKTLTGKDLIPVLSFIFLRGRCGYCGIKLSFFYPLVEIVTGMIYAFVVIWLGEPVRVLPLVSLLGLVSCAIVIFFADFKYQIIPDSIQITLLLFSLLYLISEGIFNIIIVERLIAGVVIMAPILLLFTVTKGRGMGFGDVKLAFTIGFLLGIMQGSLALYIGFILGASVGIILILTKQKGLKSKIAFGPFLVMGLMIMLFFGTMIVQIVKSIYSF